jgi:hypothetical protein
MESWPLVVLLGLVVVLYATVFMGSLIVVGKVTDAALHGLLC